MDRTLRFAGYGIAAAYAYGACVHVANMAGLTGFDWLSAPLKWQVLDLVYLALDIAVVAGVVMANRIWIVAFGIAATSQLILYTALRSWVLDVPKAFAVPPESGSYLDGLVAFHTVSLAVVGTLIFLSKQTRRAMS
ncbi:hypothetical protein [Yoonia sp. SS1-5]|uniref:Uncharacterized protein n=1 Tax=Yoonia rhodophyticola TaxID=3137370 RepID=A0AAN0NJ04_9RHOB